MNVPAVLPPLLLATANPLTGQVVDVSVNTEMVANSEQWADGMLRRIPVRAFAVLLRALLPPHILDDKMKAAIGSGKCYTEPPSLDPVCSFRLHRVFCAEYRSATQHEICCMCRHNIIRGGWDGKRGIDDCILAMTVAGCSADQMRLVRQRLSPYLDVRVEDLRARAQFGPMAFVAPFSHQTAWELAYTIGPRATIDYRTFLPNLTPLQARRFVQEPLEALFKYGITPIPPNGEQWVEQWPVLVSLERDGTRIWHSQTRADVPPLRPFMFVADTVAQAMEIDEDSLVDEVIVFHHHDPCTCNIPAHVACFRTAMDVARYVAQHRHMFRLVVPDASHVSFQNVAYAVRTLRARKKLEAILLVNGDEHEPPVARSVWYVNERKAMY